MPGFRAGGRVRLAELLAVLSSGVDLGMGQPMEHIMRLCQIALWPTAGRVHSVTHGDDAAAYLVAEHQRGLDNHRSDPAVLVVVHVRSAHSDRANPHQRIVRTRLRDWALLQLDRLRPRQYRCPHRGVHVVPHQAALSLAL